MALLFRLGHAVNDNTMQSAMDGVLGIMLDHRQLQMRILGMSEVLLAFPMNPKASCQQLLRMPGHLDRTETSKLSCINRDTYYLTCHAKSLRARVLDPAPKKRNES